MLFRLETDSGNVVKKRTATQKINDFFFFLILEQDHINILLLLNLII